MKVLKELAAAAALLVAAPALAQDQPAASASPAAESASEGEEAASDTSVPSEIEVDPATVKMPELAFQPTPEITDDFDKYFYFHREDTSFAEALADINECDALSSGSNIYLGADAGSTSAAMTQYGPLAGAIGSAIGSAIADAIFGSAMRRQQRRMNLRNCMGFKGYQRYGLSGELWKAFNFEEGHGRKKEDVRNAALAQQALVASGPKPAAKELGL